MENCESMALKHHTIGNIFLIIIQISKMRLLGNFLK